MGFAFFAMGAIVGGFIGYAAAMMLGRTNG